MRKDAPANSRQWEREPATIPVSLVLKGGRYKADHSATTVDISLRGASVRTYLALAPGEWVGVVAKGEFPHAIPSRVVWVREDEYSYWNFAGLEFLQTSEV
jgi:hypothetical protein